MWLLQYHDTQKSCWEVYNLFLGVDVDDIAEEEMEIKRSTGANYEVIQEERYLYG